jgi:DNA-binding response OmpR family regulator
VPGKVLIVHSEPAASEPLRQALESRGFTAEVLSDPRSLHEQAQQQRPALMVLAVELQGGQNGYLLCGKLKKDEELQHIPVIITGNPDGFASHQKLKARADGYLAHPADPTALADLAESLTRGGTAQRQEPLIQGGTAQRQEPLIQGDTAQRQPAGHTSSARAAPAPSSAAPQPLPLWLKVVLGLGAIGGIGVWLAFR